MLPHLGMLLVKDSGPKHSLLFVRNLMKMNDQECITVVDSWLARFNDAIADKSNGMVDKKLAELFHSDSYWRDALALSWCLQTVTHNESIRRTLRALTTDIGITDLQLDVDATPPRIVRRAGKDAIEAFFQFQTNVARCRGILRLMPGDNQPGVWRAWTFFTAMEELTGFEEENNQNRLMSESYSRDFRGPNWLDKRVAAAEYCSHNPQVLIVGGGHAGLSIAARLVQLGVDTLIVDKNSKVGDNWRNRYHALTLHNQRHVNHLPYMPFPPTWPNYIPKDMLALWFESYVAVMELNFWTESEVTSAIYDSRTSRWKVDIRQAGDNLRQLEPRHVIMATGVSGIPNLPHMDTLSKFAGLVVHSSQYHDGEDWSGKNAIVLGCGNSGHDIAQDLHSSGAHVTMIQRGPSLVVNIEPSAQIPYMIYDEKRSTDECDFITTSMPMPLTKKAHVDFTKQARDTDRALLERLENIGFKLDFGEDDTGWQFKYLTRGGGYYFNVGCSNLLVDGKIDLVQFDQIDSFTFSGMNMIDRRAIDADIIILATGYKPQEHLVSKLFGDDVASLIGPIWGYGDTLELRNMYCQTNQPGLWFIAGSFAQCRINSKYLALQIKAIEQGIIPHQAPRRISQIDLAPSF
jgi:cation diffusion facilitator CzcD-associated flavoprotein CzcO